MEIVINGQRHRIDPAKSRGQGGEAEIFEIDPSLVVKIFKPPNHPDFAGMPEAQEAARQKIEEHQQKLPRLLALASRLPDKVSRPKKLAYDRNNKQIVGYEMNFLRNVEVLYRYGQRNFRGTGITNVQMLKILRDLHKTVSEVHKAQFIIGDFNDLNVLVANTDAFIIDVDSMQFENFVCRLFTTRFVDPLLCDPRGTSPNLVRSHTPNSDWYAFTVMLMQSLLFVDPYGGVYRPKDKNKLIPHDQRPLKRITVFHPEVRYPKPARPYNILSDELLDYFQKVFVRDQRNAFPDNLLDEMRWTICSVCKTEHARHACPNCFQIAPSAVKEVIVVRGKVTATRVFQTTGNILFATMQDGQLKWLYHENGSFRRENKSSVLQGDLDPRMSFRIFGNATLAAKEGQLITLKPDDTMEKLSVETCQNISVFDANSQSRYWADNGQLMMDGALGPERIGDILSGQTRFWVGSEFGFGFYRAGNLNIAFVFSADQRGINDSVKLPHLPGQLIDTACYFAKDRCWFLVSLQHNGKTRNLCFVVMRDGTVTASAEGTPGDDTWLSDIHGKCAAGNFLLAATDDGIVRIEAAGNKLVKVKEFPDTEPFVDEHSSIFANQQGLYVIGPREIHLLKIS